MGQGSMRRRGEDAWELRVYQGTDPETRRQRWLTRTVHGSDRFARRQLEDLVAEAGRAGSEPARSDRPGTVPGDFQSIRRFAERDHKNIAQWHAYDVGGH